jgi:hypothetical protein
VPRLGYILQKLVLRQDGELPQINPSRVASHPQISSGEKELLSRLAKGLADAKDRFHYSRGQEYKDQAVIIQKSECFVRRDRLMEKFERKGGFNELVALCKRSGVFKAGRSSAVSTIEKQVAGQRLNCFHLDVEKLDSLLKIAR